MEYVIDHNNLEYLNLKKLLIVAQNSSNSIGDEEFKRDKELQKAIDFINKTKKIRKEDLRLYCTDYEEGFKGKHLSLMDIFSFNLHNIKGLKFEEIIDKMRRLNEEELLQNIYGILGDYEGKLFKSKEDILKELRNMAINGEFKWNLMMALENPLEFMKGLCEFLEKCRVILNKYLYKFKVIGQQWNDELENLIGEKGIEWFKDTYDIIPFNNFNHCTNIYISLVSVNDFDITWGIGRDNNGYIYLGNKSREMVEAFRGKNNFDNLMRCIKNISDPSRFKILKLISNRAKYGQELAHDLNLTTPTVSYHITALKMNKLINEKYEGKKMYYSLNKDTLKEMIKILEKELQL
ncbi:ArsR/SmtB family transcription factor [Clostridium hydrogeniformans]|uniref:ArsR/SmtB family transcription factor n=1 Tax=Clostridium hydrogeniformans TaxID=349933 RepID=UPI00048099A5|nr:metalloregulator ArsR/SmtB family transcription factor [Clostridium hydrogeniformans]